MPKIPHQLFSVLPAMSVFETKKGYFASLFSFINPWKDMKQFILFEGNTSTILFFRSSLLLFSMIISISKFDKLLLSIITQITRFYNVLHNYVLKYLQKSLFGSFVFESCHHDWPVLSFFQLFDQHLKNQCIDCFWFANAIKWIYHFSKMNIIAYCALHF